MNDPLRAQIRQLLEEVETLESGKLFGTAGERVATMILQRAELRDTLKLLLAYLEGFEKGHSELLVMLRKLLALTRQYHDPQGNAYISLKPGTGPQFQALLQEIKDYLALRGLE